MSHLVPSIPGPRFGGDRNPYISLGRGCDGTTEEDESKIHPPQVANQATPKTWRWSSNMISGLLLDFVSILVSITILIFALVGCHSDGNVVGPWEEKLLSIPQIIATAFPFIFAFIVGRAIQSVLCWRLEKGVDCLSFEYLNQGLTLGSAYSAPFKIGYHHWLSVILVIFWAFSPVGSQASLRFLTVQREAASTHLQDAIQYIYPTVTFDSACASCSLSGREAIFMVPFLSIGSMSQESRDVWGNIKIPLLLDYFGDGNDSGGWQQVPPETEVVYAGLVGIPFSMPQVHGNIDFVLQSWYWQLGNATLRDSASPGALLNSTSKYGGSYRLQNYTGINGLWQFGLVEGLYPYEDTPITLLTFEVAPTQALNNSLDTIYAYGPKALSDGGATYSALRLEGILTQMPVELNVTCSALACNVTAIRHGTMDPSYDSSLDFSYFDQYFLRHLSSAFPLEHVGSPYPGVLEAYLYDSSQTPYNVLGSNHAGVDLTNTSCRTLEVGLTQVLNTYWIVDNYFTHASGGFNVSDPMFDRIDAIHHSSGTATTDQDIMRCDNTWNALLCMSTLLMIFASISSVLMNWLRIAPNSTDFLSAMVLHDGKTLRSNWLFLSTHDRIGELKDVKLKIGDIKPEEEIGEMAIGRHSEVGTLKDRRLYR